MPKIKGQSHTDQAIVHTCTYITDDRYIASYHGVSLERVKQVRAKMGNVTRGPKKIPGLRVDDAAKSSVKITALGTTNEERLFRANARDGSARLLAALLKHFENRRKGVAA